MPFSIKPVRARGSTLDEATLTRIVDAFGLQHYVGLQPILLDGATATLLALRSETAAKAILETRDACWFVKEVPWYLGREDAINVVALADLARENGLPVPRIRQTESGESLLRIGEALYSVWHFVHGNRYEYSERQVRAGGKTLARLHNIAAPSWLPRQDWPQLVASQLFALEKQPGTARRELVHFIEVATCVIDRIVRARRTERNECRPMLSHGDYNPWNVLFDEDHEVCAIVDFDNAGRDFPARDIAEAILAWTTIAYRHDSTRLRDEVPGPIKADRACNFLKAYSSVRAIGEHEWALVRDGLQVSMIELLSLALLRGDIRHELGDRLAERILLLERELL